MIAGERAKAAYGDAERGLVDVGVVDEAQKAALLAHCRALAQPSINESYSRVMVEAWLYGRPVLVNEACSTTAGAVRRSNGGFLVSGETGWARALERTDAADDASLAQTGSLGRNYALARGAWDAVIERYVVAFASEPARPQPQTRSSEETESSLDAPMQRYADGLSNALAANARKREVRHVREPARLALPGPNAIVVYHGTSAPPSNELRGDSEDGAARLFGALPEARDALRAAGYEARAVVTDLRRSASLRSAGGPRALRRTPRRQDEFVYVGPFASSRTAPRVARRVPPLLVDRARSASHDDRVRRRRPRRFRTRLRRGALAQSG